MDISSTSSSSDMEEGSIEDSEREDDYAFRLGEEGSNEDFDDENDDEDDDDMDEDEEDHNDEFGDQIGGVVHGMRYLDRSLRLGPSIRDLNQPSFDFANDAALRDMLRTTIQTLARSGSMGELRNIHFERVIGPQNEEPLRILTSRFHDSPIPVRSYVRRTDQNTVHPSLRRHLTGHIPSDIEDLDANSVSDPGDGRAPYLVLRSLSRLQYAATETNIERSDAINSYVQHPFLQTSVAESLSSTWDYSLSGPSGFFSRSRHIDRFMNNHRDRDKIPSAIQRRWTYHPPSEGGDTLSAIFDSGTTSRRNPKLYGGKPLVAVESHASVEEIAQRVTNRFDSLLSELRMIDDKVEKAERRVEHLKKRLEKKQAEEEKKAKEVKKTSEAKSNPKVEIVDDESSQQMELSRADASPATPAGRDHDRTQIEPDTCVESAVPLQQAISRSVPGLGNAQEDMSLPNLVMDSIEISRRRTSTSQSLSGAEESSQVPNQSSQTEAVVEPNIPENEEATPTGEAQRDGEAENTSTDANNFSELAAQRAAAAGISLEAPANVNPDVVAAATESTGIDPVILADLPEEMITEILTQHYDSIRTNANTQSEQPSAGATNINLDFLIALPPALRAEVLEMEAEFQSRQETQNNAGNNNGNANNDRSASVAAADMDNATFLATLPSDLREEILLTSGEPFIRSLPPNLAAEARLLRERQVNSGMPFRVNGRELSSFVHPRRNSGILRSQSGGPRDNVSIRSLPVMRWKKTDEGWLRELQDSEFEPKPFLDFNGVAALVNLLWMRYPEFGKQQIQLVLSHACKSSETRVLVLEELIKLVTSNNYHKSYVGSSGSIHAEDIEYTKNHGTAVRRGLEILSLICKNDRIVAEDLLGLPKGEADMKKATSSTNFDGRPSLSTLISLMHTTLFDRSDSHMDQLLSVINTVCMAVPPIKPTETNAPKWKRGLRSARMLLGQSGLSDPMRLLMVDADEEESGIFEMPGGNEDEDDASFEELFLPTTMGEPGSSPPQPQRENGEAVEKGNGKEGKKAEDEQVIPAEFRVPQLKESELVALTKVLLRSSCADKTHERTSLSIGILGELPANRKILMASLVAIGKEAGAEIQKEYVTAANELQSCTQANMSMKRKQLLTRFSLGSYTNDTTLVRVVKSLSALCGHDRKRQRANEKNKSGNKATRMSLTLPEEDEFRKAMSTGLRGVWTSLDKLLDLAVDETMVKEKKARISKGSATGPSVAEMLGPEGKRASRRALSPILSRLSPVIEAFIVMHTVEEAELRSRGEPGTPDVSPGTPRSPSWRTRGLDAESALGPRTVDEELAIFVERHRDPVNALLRANPILLETSFQGALRHPHAIDFDNKKAYFRNMIRKRSSESHAGTIKIGVRRDWVLNDSYHQLRMRTPEEMKGRLHIQFNGEEGVDAGGITREWYIILARQIFDPNYVLFTRSAAKAATYQPDKRSYINREHLKTFRFVGRIIAKAIYDGQLIDAYFTRSFYKHILGMKPTFHDIEGQDPDYYKSLKWILENDCTGIIDYTMSAEYDEFGKQTVIDLVPNGRNIPVIEENKAEYVRLVTEVRMSKTIEKQIEAFKEGFYEIIPLEDCKIFNELELELLMSGLPDIDMSDMKANVEYSGYTASSPQINWFWRCVSKMDQEDLARLVMFVTGTSKVPLEGFSQLQGMDGVQKLQIYRVSGDTMRLPSAHTCLNQLDLPEYSSADILSERLLRAVRECSMGFGFA